MNDFSSDTSLSSLPSFPPLPPSVFQKGNFDYISSIQEKEMISIAYKAIDLLEQWNFMKKEIDNYMFSTDPVVEKIYQKIEDLGYHGHSACSFSFTMRVLQEIAQKGEEQFMNEWLKSNK